MSARNLKVAASDNDFESSLWQIAFDKLQNKLQNLLPYLVGFEVAQKNPDNTKAIGVFGFKSKNGQILYVPVFFINGKVWDLDCMYSKNNDQFWPLNEDTAQLFLQDDITGVGSVSEEPKQKLQSQMVPADFKDFLYPPRIGRTAYASVVDYIKDSEPAVKQAAYAMIQKHAGLLEGLLRFYNVEDIASALRVEKEKTASKDVAVVVYKLGDKVPTEYTTKIAASGFAIDDKRKDEEKSKFGVFDYVSRFQNPDASGVYNYVTEIGSLRQGLILMKPMSLLADMPVDTYVLDTKGEKIQVYPVCNKKVFVLNPDPANASKLDLKSKLVEPSTIEPDYDTYILINPETWQATETLRIDQCYTDNNGLRRIIVRPDDCCAARNTVALTGDRSRVSNKCESYDTLLLFTKKEGKLDRRGNTLLVPKGFKFLKCATSIPTYLPYSPDISEADREKNRVKAKKEEARLKSGKPGTKLDILNALYTGGVFPITLSVDGNDYRASIDGKGQLYSGKNNAKIGMVVDYGLSVDDAEALIDTMRQGSTRGWIKTAAVGDYIPAMYEEAYTQGPAQLPMLQGIPQIDVAPTENPPVHMPEDSQYMEVSQGAVNAGQTGGPQGQQGQQGVDQDINAATQLAQQGQKQIFDTQAIATMAKYVDPSNKVMQYIPDFIGTMDKLGRMLFLIYWETEKFKKIYGTDDIPELIELLKSVFKNLGDLIIFFKRKFPEMSINSSEQSLKEV